MSPVAAVLLLAWAVLAAAGPTTLDITVPDSVKVEGEDAYICITKPLPDKPLKLVGVEPIAEEKVVHHILLFGCDEPYVKPKAGEEAVWECKHQPTCGGRQDAVLYGWGRNAPKLELPAGVGFSVGKGSAVKWIVMQVHYLKEKPAGDNAGVRLSVQDTPVPYSAGMLSYASYFRIPPHKKQHYVLNNCCYRGFQPLTSFAVRVHTHTMGRHVFMNRAPHTHKGPGDIIASGDPLKPQGFTPVKSKTLWPGERLTVGCEFDSSNKSSVVVAGSDHTHEMCNMYLMVYSSVAHIEMCSDGTSLVDELSPGNMPHSASLQKDPFPLWKPPQPASKLEQGVVGNVAAVALGPDGMVWVLSRGGRVWGPKSFDDQQRITETEPVASNVVMQLHPDTGKVLRQWGAGQFYMPHMITVDRNNTVWVTDVGRHQALQYSASGELLREVGKKMTPGHDNEHLCKPTQVASLNDGSFLVADGYCNSRVLRFNPDGSFHSVYQFTAKGRVRDMAVVHSLVVDECDGALVVADRENKAVHTFNLHTGAYRGTKNVAAHGKVWALIKGPYGRTLALCWDQGKDARLVDVGQQGSNVFWTIPDSKQLWPHDMALGAAALPLTGAGDRMLALYVAPLCADCGPLEKYVLVPNDFGAPAADKASQPMVLPPGQRPPLAHLGGHHAHSSHDSHGAAGPAAAATATQQPAEAAEQEEQEEQEEQQEAEEAKEEQAEEKVVEQEVKEEQQEVEALHDPKVLADLKQQLADLQKKIQEVSGEAGSKDTDSYLSFHNKAGRATDGQGTFLSSWAGTAVMAVVCLLVGGLVVFAYQKARAPRHTHGPGQQVVGNGVAYTPGCSVNGRLGSDEEVEVVSDTNRLLGNGVVRR